MTARRSLDEALLNDGALAPELKDLPAEMRRRYANLFSIADDTHRFAQALRIDAMRAVADLPWTHPLTIATLIAARSVRSFESIILLCERACGQDALAIARVICEGQIIVGGLIDCPDLTLQHLNDDGARSELRLHRLYRDLYLANEKDPDPEAAARMSAYIKKAEEVQLGKRKTLGDIATKAGASDEYFLFLDFSARAAHVGYQSLVDEVHTDEEARTSSFLVGPHIGKAVSALSKSCLVTLGLTSAIRYLFRWDQRDPELRALHGRLMADIKAAGSAAQA